MENLGRITRPLHLSSKRCCRQRACGGLQIVKDTGKKPGTVYPILERLEAAGWVQGGEWELR